MKKRIVIILVLVFGTLQSLADDISNYVGEWKSSNAKVEIILKDNGKCILKKNLKIMVDETKCIWDANEQYIRYGNIPKKETMYFKLDNNELLIEQDKRSLTREKADLIMHKI